MNTLFPSTNEWGVPDLLPGLQGDAVDYPVESWGAKSRGLAHKGTVHFYVDDYRFKAVWDKPEKLVATGCISVCEPNYTASLDTPRALYLEMVYRRRWLARYWQGFGIRTFVDMNNPTDFVDITLLGVPEGWRAYSTHGYSNRIASLYNEYHQASLHAGSEDLVFMVYGGGREVKEIANKNRWYWVAEDADRARGRIDGGTPVQSPTRERLVQRVRI
jgi:hypothetical protein